MRRGSFVLLGFLLVSWASAEIPMSLEGQLGGTSQAIALSETGTVAYLGVGPRVVTLDVSEPNDIRQIAQSEVLPEVVEDIVVRDGYAYVADGYAGLYILDASDANAPSVVGRWSHLEGMVAIRGRRVCVSGNCAYLADDSEGLHIIDISNPSEPNRLSVVDDVSPRAVAVSDGYVYVNSRETGVAVLDVSNPREPRVVPQSEPLPYVTEIAVAAGYVYVSGARDDVRGMYIIDANDPTHLVCVGRCEMAYPGKLTITEKLAYVGNGWGGIDIIRIVDPTRPSRIGGYKTQGHALATAVAGGCAYIATSNAGLEIVEVSSPTAPRPLDIYGATNFLDVAVSGPYAYMASAYTGMQVVDISDPAAPSYVSWLDLDYTSCVALGKAHIYVGDAWSFTVVDASDPWNPIVVGSCNIGAHVDDIVVVDRYAYVTAGQGLTVVDASDPHHPVVAGWCEASGYTRGVCVANGYAYVTGNHGLDIMDLFDPIAPFVVGHYHEGDSPYHAAIAGSFAYLANGNSGLRVIDVSDPFLPGRIGGLDTYSTRDIIVQAPYAFALDFRNGLQIVDLSNPVFLASLGECDMPGYGRKVSVIGDYAYIASCSGGLVILRIDWPDDSQ